MPSIPSLATGLALSSIAAAIVLINSYENQKNPTEAAPKIDTASMKCFVAGSISDPKLFWGGAQLIDSKGKSHDKAGNYLMSFTNTDGGTTNIGTGVRTRKNGDRESRWNEKVDITQDNGISIIAKKAVQDNTSGMTITVNDGPPKFINLTSESSSDELVDGRTKVEVVSNKDLQQYFTKSDPGYITDAIGLNVTQKLLSGGSLRTLILWHNQNNPYLDVVSEASDGDPGFSPNKAFGGVYTPPNIKDCPVNPPLTPSPVSSGVPTGSSPVPSVVSTGLSTEPIPSGNPVIFNAGAAM